MGFLDFRPTVTITGSGRGAPGNPLPTTFNRNRWWEQGGLTFGPSGLTDEQRNQIAISPMPQGTGFASLRGGPTQQVRIPPEYFATGGFDSPQSFADWFQNASPEQQSTVRSQGRAVLDSRSARQSAIEGLRGVFGQVETGLTGFREDPEREAIAAALRERTGGDYRVFSQLEESALRNQLSQAYAQGQAARAGRAAGRGVSQSGVTLQNLAAQEGIARAGGLRIGAEVEGVNRLARERALGELSRFEDRGLAIEQQMINALGQLESQIAGIESGAEFQPFDFTGFEAFDFGRDIYLTEAERADRELDILADQNKPGAIDFVELLEALRGIGLQDQF